MNRKMDSGTAAKISDGKVFPPSCQPLLESPVQSDKTDKDDAVKMEKSLGLLEGTAIILGIIMGSGTNIIIKSTHKAYCIFNEYYN